MGFCGESFYAFGAVVAVMQGELGRSAGGCPRRVRSWAVVRFMNCNHGALLGFLVKVLALFWTMFLKVLVLFGFCGAFGVCVRQDRREGCSQCRRVA